MASGCPIYSAPVQVRHLSTCGTSAYMWSQGQEERQCLWQNGAVTLDSDPFDHVTIVNAKKLVHASFSCLRLTQHTCSCSKSASYLPRTSASTIGRHRKAVRNARDDNYITRTQQLVQYLACPLSNIWPSTRAAWLCRADGLYQLGRSTSRWQKAT
jgi:hypothetical protein